VEDETLQYILLTCEVTTSGKKEFYVSFETDVVNGDVVHYVG